MIYPLPSRLYFSLLWISRMVSIVNYTSHWLSNLESPDWDGRIENLLWKLETQITHLILKMVLRFVLLDNSYKLPLSFRWCLCWLPLQGMPSGMPSWGMPLCGGFSFMGCLFRGCLQGFLLGMPLLGMPLWGMHLWGMPLFWRTPCGMPLGLPLQYTTEIDEKSVIYHLISVLIFA